VARVWLSIFRVLRRSGVIAPWIPAPWLFVAFRWASSVGFDPRLIYLALVCGWFGFTWMGFARPRLRPTDSGIWFRGRFRDEFFPWSRVERVVADDRGIVIRLTDGDAAAVGVPQGRLTWLLRGVDDPVQAARVCEDLRLRSGIRPASGPTPGLLSSGFDLRRSEPRGQRRISPQILCGVAWSLAALAGLVGWIH
jgi:hypothetical protein